MNGTLYFQATDGTNGSELWKSDGTSAGTLLVRDINPGLGDSRSRYLTNVNGTLYFRATDGSSGSELWKSDGTSAGTVQVRDLLPGLTGSLPSSLTNVNGRLYFAASDGTSGMELWSTDGTSAGTVRASDINPGAGNSNPGQLLNLNGTVYFAADNGTGSELWQVRSSITVSGNTLNVSGGPENNVVVINFTSPTNYAITVDGQTDTFDTTTYSTIVVDTGGGSDSLTVNLSSLADTATLNGPSGSITSSNYAISYTNVETTVLNGGANDQVTYNDPGVVNTAYLLPVYGILQGFGFSNQAIAFGNYTVNAAGNDDNLFIYGDTGVQAYVATPTQARMPVGSQVLLGNNFKRVYAYGMGGNDTATYSGSALDETMTALAFYTFVNTISTVQYFDSFKTLTVAGNGGLDIAVMYDTSGVDSFTASDTSFRYTRSGVFNNIANGYDRVYAFNYFGGFDTATLNGSSGNDRLTSIANYSVLVTPTTLQQAIGFRTVIVNAGTGTDTATLQDSTGSDTLNAFAGTAELVYSNGRTARAIGFDTVNANGTLGGTNRRNLNSPTYQLKFKGTWV